MKCHLQLSISNSLVHVPFPARHGRLCTAEDRQHPGMICYMPHLRILPFSCSGLVTRLELNITARYMLSSMQLCTVTWQLSYLMPVFWQELAVSRNAKANAMRDAVKGRSARNSSDHTSWIYRCPGAVKRIDWSCWPVCTACNILPQICIPTQ